MEYTISILIKEGGNTSKIAVRRTSDGKICINLKSNPQVVESIDGEDFERVEYEDLTPYPNVDLNDMLEHVYTVLDECCENGGESLYFSEGALDAIYYATIAYMIHRPSSGTIIVDMDKFIISGVDLKSIVHKLPTTGSGIMSTDFLEIIKSILQ